MAIEIISASKQISRNKMIDVICKDNNTKIIRLVVPTEVDGVDLSNLTWTINVENANNEKDLQTPSSVAIKDGNILIDWTIHGIATTVPGITKYQYIGISESGMVWQNAKMYLNVRDRIESTPFEGEEDILTDLQKLIIYVNAELENIIEAKDIAINAAERAEEAAKRVENAGGGNVTPEQISQAVEDYLTKNPVEFTEEDPTVPVWAKAAEKPKYTAEEVGAASKEAVERLSEEKADKLNEPVLIESITLESGIDTLYKSTEPDGTPYNFKKIIIKIKATPTEKTGNWILYPMDSAIDSLSRVMIQNFPSTSQTQYGAFVCDIYDGLMNFHGYKGTTIYSYSATYSSECAPAKSAIKNVKIMAANGMAEGTVFEIWAVRA